MSGSKEALSAQPKTESKAWYMLPLALIIVAGLFVNVGLSGAILSETRSNGSSAEGELTTDPNPTDPVSSVGGSPLASNGTCTVDVRLQTDGETLIGIPGDWKPENNIVVKLPSNTDCDVAVSPTWTVAGWNVTIVQLAANATFETPTTAPNERQLIKLLRGTLLEINENGVLRADGHWETYVVTAPNRPASLFIDSNVESIEAGSQGAVFVYFKVTTDILEKPITDMTKSPATDVAGPFSENLVWNQFGTFYGDFAEVEFYNLAGLLLHESDDSRLAYLQFWTLREDEDADGYHDHSNLEADNAFAEIHMAMFAANGVSGMQTTLPNTENLNFEQNPSPIPAGDAHKLGNNNQTEVQISIPMPPGHAHGPLWSVDPADGKPTLLCGGGIMYPFHRWLISDEGVVNSPLRYSMWVAFEHLPEDAVVPKEMITLWANANLQTTMEAANCTTA